MNSHPGISAFYRPFFVSLLFFRAALYLEKLGEDCLEEAMMEMDNALARMVPR